MSLPAFEIESPASEQEACKLLERHGDEAALYCGGTELLLLLKLGFSAARQLVDLKRVPSLRRLEVADGALIVGAAVTHRTLERSPLVAEALPTLVELEQRLANVRVRAAGTFGGNLCFADPHSDPATFLLATGGDVVVAGPMRERVLPVAQFALGPYQTALEPNELLREIHVTLPPEGAAISHLKISFHERPAATMTCLLAPGEARLAAGSVGVRPERLGEAEALLASLDPADPDPVGLAEAAAAAAAACNPTDDENGSTDYKRHLVATLTRRAYDDARRRLGTQ